MSVVPDNATLCTCGSPIGPYTERAIKRIKRDCPKCGGVGWYTAEGPGRHMSMYFPPGVEIPVRHKA